MYWTTNHLSNIGHVEGIPSWASLWTSKHLNLALLILNSGKSVTNVWTGQVANQWMTTRHPQTACVNGRKAQRWFCAVLKKEFIQKYWFFLLPVVFLSFLVFDFAQFKGTGCVPYNIMEANDTLLEVLQMPVTVHRTENCNACLQKSWFQDKLQTSL